MEQELEQEQDQKMEQELKGFDPARRAQDIVSICSLSSSHSTYNVTACFKHSARRGLLVICRNALIVFGSRHSLDSPNKEYPSNRLISKSHPPSSPLFIQTPVDMVLLRGPKLFL